MQQCFWPKKAQNGVFWAILPAGYSWALGGQPSPPKPRTCCGTQVVWSRMALGTSKWSHTGLEWVWMMDFWWGWPVMVHMGTTAVLGLPRAPQIPENSPSQHNQDHLCKNVPQKWARFGPGWPGMASYGSNWVQSGQTWCGVGPTTKVQVAWKGPGAALYWPLP